MQELIPSQDHLHRWIAFPHHMRGIVSKWLQPHYLTSEIADVVGHSDAPPSNLMGYVSTILVLAVESDNVCCGPIMRACGNSTQSFIDSIQWLSWNISFFLGFILRLRQCKTNVAVHQVKLARHSICWNDAWPDEILQAYHALLMSYSIVH